MTPHNEAEKGDYADAVLLPGDPDRAKWIAETYFDNARCVNRVRGALGYTGTYKGMPVSVQTTGMGRPSISIYMHELINTYGCRTFMRIGSCGALDASVGLRSSVIVRAAVRDFDIGNIDAWRRPDDRLFAIAVERARATGIDYHVSDMVCSDVFYHGDPLGRFAAARARGVRACDMEASASLGMAARFGARALAICTVVDSLITHEEIAHSERQAVFGPMVKLALDTLIEDRTSPAGKLRSL